MEYILTPSLTNNTLLQYSLLVLYTSYPVPHPLHPLASCYLCVLILAYLHLYFIPCTYTLLSPLYLNHPRFNLNNIDTIDLGSKPSQYKWKKK